MKRLFLLFLICLSNVLAMPLYISASDNTSLSSGVNMPVVEAGVHFDELDVAFEAEPEVVATISAEIESDDIAIDSEQTVVQTIVEDVPVDEPVAVETVSVEPVVIESAVESTTEPATVEPVVEPVVVEPVQEPVVESRPIEQVKPVANFIAIVGRVIPIEDVDSTLVDSGDHVNHYDKKFYYGHNSAAVFGGIVNMGVGDTFSITYGGVTTTYRVAETMIYEKNTSNGLLQLNGEGDYMWYVSKARIGKKRFDVSLMTCYGTSYGNGDASHRFVIFAYKV